MPLIQGYITVYDVWTSEAAWYLSHYHGYKDLEGINYIRGSVFAVSHVMASREVVMGVAKDGNEHHKNSIDLSTDWEVLGPFQIGTRGAISSVLGSVDDVILIPFAEATWGADPLEAQGGFRALEYDRNATFRSSLSRDGTVTWSHHQLERMSRSANTSSGYLTVSFPEVDWSFLQSVYGWGALQFQAWARGTLILNSPHCQSILLYTENLLEFWLDGKPYFGGDLYSYRRAPLTLPLDPGQHRLEVRLLRDVRVMGGIGDPIIQAKIEAQVASGSLTVVEDRNIFPDIVDGKLPSNLGSIPVRNESLTWIHILGLESADVRILDAREAERMLILPWRTSSVLHYSRMLRSVLRLGKQGHCRLMSIYFIPKRSTSRSRSSTPLMIRMKSAFLPSFPSKLRDCQYMSPINLPSCIVVASCHTQYCDHPQRRLGVIETIPIYSLSF